MKKKRKRQLIGNGLGDYGKNLVKKNFENYYQTMCKGIKTHFDQKPQ